MLTLFEVFGPEQLPFYIELTGALHERDLPVPCPLKDKNGSAIQMLHDKPVLLFPFVAGEHLQSPTNEEIRKMARVMANMHRESLTLPLQHSLPTDSKWMEQTWKFVKSSLSGEENQLIEGQLHLREALQSLDLPRAIIHRDLFRDNVLFQ
ncbi:MAG: phosphotransferase [Gammaproteobacteria bacterium]|nr:phosphotransferase [Gammaproteobacteria bacterium]